MHENAAIVRSYIDVVWNQGRTDQGPRFLAEDLAQHNPHVPDGRAAVLSFVHTLKAAHPEARFDIRRLAADGELVFIHSHFTTGPDDRGSVVVDVFRLSEGLIVEHWDVATPLIAEAAVSGRPIV